MESDLDGQEREIAVALRIGVLGLGSVFCGPYRSIITRLAHEGRVELAAAFDPDPAKRDAIHRLESVDTDFVDADDLISRDDLDVVLVLTNMNEHGPLALAALKRETRPGGEAMATEPGRGACPRRNSKGSERCSSAPRTSSSPRPTGRCTAVSKARWGISSGPFTLRLGRASWWGKWFYQPGGGALFDLGVYNLSGLCGFFASSARDRSRGTTIKERIGDDETIKVEAGTTRTSCSTSATRASVRDHRLYDPEISLARDRALRRPRRTLADGRRLGSGRIRTLAQRDRRVGGLHERGIPPGPGPTAADTSSTASRPVHHTGHPARHAYHALESCWPPTQSAQDGRFIEIESTFPELEYHDVVAAIAEDDRRIHDPRTLV